MNRPSVILLGAWLVVLASMGGLVVAPGWQQRGLQPVEVAAADGTTGMYPAAGEPEVEAGREVFRASGCIYCHSQQVRPEPFGADLARGWGTRRSLPRDYVLQSPPLLGTMRTGPDLANIGVRQPSDDWHHLHLYDARLVSRGSVMPPFSYLYSVTTRPPAGHAVALPAASGAPPRWLTPSRDALALVAYLKSLQQPYAVQAVQ